MFTQGMLLLQFTGMKDHGTRIVLYNLWEDDQGQLELDFDTDPYVSSPVACLEHGYQVIKAALIKNTNQGVKDYECSQNWPSLCHPCVFFRHLFKRSDYKTQLIVSLVVGYSNQRSKS